MTLSQGLRASRVTCRSDLSFSLIRTTSILLSIIIISTIIFARQILFTRSTYHASLLYLHPFESHLSFSNWPYSFPQTLLHGLNGPFVLGKNPRFPVVVAEKNFPELDRSRLIIFRARVLSLSVLTTSLLGLDNRVPRVDCANVLVYELFHVWDTGVIARFI